MLNYTFFIIYAYEILHKNNDKKVTNCRQKTKNKETKLFCM